MAVSMDALTRAGGGDGKPSPAVTRAAKDAVHEATTAASSPHGPDANTVPGRARSAASARAGGRDSICAAANAAVRTGAALPAPPLDEERAAFNSARNTSRRNEEKSTSASSGSSKEGGILCTGDKMME